MRHCIIRSSTICLVAFLLLPYGSTLGQVTNAKPTSTSALSAKELELHWAALAGDDAAKAYRSIWALVGAAKESVSYMKERMQPVPELDAKQVDQWLTDLDSNRFNIRKKASDGLEKLGEMAEPSLKKALGNKPTLEMRQRLESLLRKLEGPITTPETLRLVRAVEVLELAGTAEAHELLAALTKGSPEARLTREAKESLERLNKRVAASH